jgi:hypothetical protein
MAVVADSRGQDLVQGAVDGLTSPQLAREASIALEQQEGVLMARFDSHTRNMMLHVSPAMAIDAAMINGWLSGLDVRVRCFSRRAAREGPFRHIDAERCGGNPTPER